MGLSMLKSSSTIVELPSVEGGTTALTLYGLTAANIADLVTEHRDAIETVYGAVIANEVGSHLGEIVALILRESPLLLAGIIAWGCREPENIELAANLPAGMQITIIEKIATLTFAGESDPKKVWEIVAGAVKSLTSSLNT